MTTTGDADRVSSPVVRGQVVVVVMIGVAIIAGIFAWYWNYNRGRRALAFFGAQGATLIRLAPRVELLRPDDRGELDLSHSPGLINARAALLSDASYEWSEQNPIWKSAISTVRFSDRRRSLEVSFDFENRTIKSSSTGRTAKLKQKTAEGWQNYLSRRAPAPAVANEVPAAAN